MERNEYQDKIRELLQTVTTLLDQNKAMGERLEKAATTISKANDEIESLKTELARLKGENAMRRRKCPDRQQLL